MALPQPIEAALAAYRRAQFRFGYRIGDQQQAGAGEGLDTSPEWQALRAAIVEELTARLAPTAAADGGAAPKGYRLVPEELRRAFAIYDADPGSSEVYGHLKFQCYAFVRSLLASRVAEPPPPPAAAQSGSGDDEPSYTPALIHYPDDGRLEFVERDTATVTRHLSDGCAVLLDMTTSEPIGFYIEQAGARLPGLLAPAPDDHGLEAPVRAEDFPLLLVRDVADALVRRVERRGLDALYPGGGYGLAGTQTHWIEIAEAAIVVVKDALARSGALRPASTPGRVERELCERIFRRGYISGRLTLKHAFEQQVSKLVEDLQASNPPLSIAEFALLLIPITGGLPIDYVHLSRCRDAYLNRLLDLPPSDHDPASGDPSERGPSGAGVGL